MRRKRARTQSPEKVRGDEEEIIDFIVGREHAIVKDARKVGESDLPDIPSLADDAPLNNYLDTLNQIEVSDENPVVMTSKGSKDVALPLGMKRRQRKGMAATIAKEVDKGGVVARVNKGKKDKGKKVAEGTEKTKLTPQLPTLPPQLTGPAGLHLTYYFPLWRIFGHHSMLQVAADKKMKEALGLEWEWEATM
ncbi:hypothetical protein Dimus_005043 [Dionaea muscipula]